MNCELPINALSLSAAFAAGIASSLHCLTMCGGIMGALALRVRSMTPVRAIGIRHHLLYQLGRLGTYGALGAAGGGLGQGFGHLLSRWHLANVLRMAAALIILLLALQILSKVPLLRPLERWGSRFWGGALRAFQRTHGRAFRSSFTIGALWGLMPCGLVYSMLAVAALSASARTGTLLMICFGVGTLPAVLSGSIVSIPFQRLHAPALVRGAGLLLLIFGVWTAYSAMRV